MENNQNRAPQSWKFRLIRNRAGQPERFVFDGFNRGQETSRTVKQSLTVGGRVYTDDEIAEMDRKFDDAIREGLFCRGGRGSQCH